MQFGKPCSDDTAVRLASSFHSGETGAIEMRLAMYLNIFRIR